MYNVDLYTTSNSCPVEAARYVLKKYGHFIKFKDNASILELGTGDGRTTIEVLLPILPKDYKELILSDKSTSMLDHARQMKSLSTMEFIEMEAEIKDVRKNLRNRFDLIFSNFALHFVKDSRQTIQNIFDMLKPGGEAFCSFLAECPTDSAWEALGKHPRWSQYDPNPFVSPYYKNPKIFEIYRKHLNECGFENIAVMPETFGYEFLNEKQFKDLLISVNMSVKKIPPHLLEEYLQDYFELVSKDKSYSFKVMPDGKRRSKFHLSIIVFYAVKPSCSNCN